VFPTTPPSSGSVIRFDIDLRFSHAVVEIGRPGKWLVREGVFPFLGWALVTQAVDGGGWRAGIEAMLLVNGQVVPSSLIATVLVLRDGEQAVVTQIVPYQGTE
jgi:hypothetical protein